MSDLMDYEFLVVVPDKIMTLRFREASDEITMSNLANSLYNRLAKHHKVFSMYLFHYERVQS